MRVEVALDFNCSGKAAGRVEECDIYPSTASQRRNRPPPRNDRCRIGKLGYWNFEANPTRIRELDMESFRNLH